MEKMNIYAKRIKRQQYVNDTMRGSFEERKKKQQIMLQKHQKL